jgi:TonB family protein
MRRRDANGKHSLQLTRGGPSTTAVAVVLALAVHAGALLALVGVRIPSASTPPLIRVSLLPGGGDGTERGKRGAMGTKARPESSREAPAEPARQQAAPQQPRRSRLPKAKRAAVRKSVKSDSGSVAPPAPMAAASLATAAGSGTTDGTASANGTGAGMDGSGPGWGHGGGSGNGTGLGPRASCVYCPQPHYPLIARARGWQGTVEVLLSVLADGSVNAATLWHSSGYSVLDRAAVAAARHSRFSPPQPAPLRGRMEYRFELVTAR